MAVKTYSFVKDGGVKLSDHFSVREFKSYSDDLKKLTSDEIKIDENLPRALERVFAALNCSKIIITSGYRSPDFEAYLSKGKATTGQHVLGTAADIICYNQAGTVIDPKTVCCTAQDLSMTGIGFMAGGTHIDVRANRSWFDETKNNAVVSDWYSCFGAAKPQAAPAPAPVPIPVPAAPAEKTYTVQSGDSFWKIASTQMGNGNKYKQLAEYNGLKPTDTIYKGQILKIPQ